MAWGSFGGMLGPMNASGFHLSQPENGRALRGRAWMRRVFSEKLRGSAAQGTSPGISCSRSPAKGTSPGISCSRNPAKGTSPGISCSRNSAKGTSPGISCSRSPAKGTSPGTSCSRNPAKGTSPGISCSRNPAQGTSPGISCSRNPAQGTSPGISCSRNPAQGTSPQAPGGENSPTAPGWTAGTVFCPAIGWKHFTQATRTAVARRFTRRMVAGSRRQAGRNLIP